MFLPKDLRYYQTPVFNVGANSTATFFVDVPSTARTLYTLSQVQEVAGDARITFSVDNDVIAQNADQGFFNPGNNVSLPTQPAPGRLFAKKCYPQSEFKVTIENLSPGERDFQFMVTYLQYEIDVAPRRVIGYDQDVPTGTSNFRFRLPSKAEKLIQFRIGELQFFDLTIYDLTIDNQELMESVEGTLFQYGNQTSNFTYAGYLNYPISQNSNIFLSANNPAGAFTANYLLYYI